MEEGELNNAMILTVNEQHSSAMERKATRKLSPIEKRVKLRNKTASGRTVKSLTKSLLKPITDIDVEEFKEKLEEGGDPNGDTQTWGEWRPIFWAATSGNHSVLSLLLADPRTNINVTDNNGYTALHHAVISACRKSDEDGRYRRCIDLLLECPNMKVNIPDKRGYTALGRAVHESNKKCIEQMLKHSLTVKFHLDYIPVDRSSTLREMIMKTYPELLPFLPQPFVEDFTSNDNARNLLASLQRGDYSSFCEFLQDSNPNPWYGEPYHSTLLEIACQMKNREEFIAKLLQNGANPNIKHRITGLPLLHSVVESCCFDNLIMLLRHKDIDLAIKDDEYRTVLHCLAKVCYKEKSDKEKLAKCFEIFLGNESELNNENHRVNIDDRDSLGKTALHIAVQHEHQDRILLFLRYGADVIIDKQGIPMLSSISANALEEILDECVEHNSEPVTSMEFKLTFKFDILPNILVHISNMPHLRHLLRHPVIETYLSLKWKHIKIYFFLDLVIYALFVLLLTIYVLLWNEFCTESKMNSNSTKAAIMSPRNCEFNENYSQVLIYLWYPVMGLMVILAVREIFQLLIYGLIYFLSPENWLEILLIATSFLSTSGVVENNYLIHSSAISVLLAWLELVVLMGKLPLLSVQLEMLLTVSWTFLRFMAGYILLLVAFAFSFHILFKSSLEPDGDDMFRGPHISLLKTIVMFSGEFDASSLSFDTAPYTSHIIFAIFIFLVAIILLNLLNGLAVNDTEVIRRDAETLSLVARLKLTQKIEKFTNAFPKCLSSINEPTENVFSFYPNRKNSIHKSTVLSSLQFVSKKKKQKNKNKNTLDNKMLDSLIENVARIQLRQEEVEMKLLEKYEQTQQILMSILSQLEK